MTGGRGLVGEGSAGAFDGAPVVRVKLRIHVVALVVNHKGHICYWQPHVQEHLFVEGLDAGDFGGEGIHFCEPVATLGRIRGRGPSQMGGVAERRFTEVNTFAVNICPKSYYAKAICLHHSHGIFIQEPGIGLEVDYAAGDHERPVAVKEHGGREP